MDQEPILKPRALAALVLLTALTASTAYATPFDTGKEGRPPCVRPPAGLPGLSGPPLWPPASNGTPAAPADTSKRERTEVSDPRWGNGPLIPMAFPAENASYRYRIVAVDSHTLHVSIQTINDVSGPTADDYIMFGFASNAGNQAFGVKLVPTNPSFPEGSPRRQIRIDATADSTALSFNFDSGAATKWTRVGGLPSWIDVAQAAWWGSLPLVGTSMSPSELQDGANWAIQFKVNLPTGLDASTVRFFVGMRATLSTGATATAVDAASSDIWKGCAKSTCPVFPVPGAGAPFQLAFPDEPKYWPLLTTPDCANGVNLRGEQIVSQAFAGDPLTVNVDPLDINKWEITPSNGAMAGTGVVAADLFVANWGTVVAGVDAGWTRMFNQSVAPVNDATGKITYSCQNPDKQGLNICGIVPEANIINKPDGFHQCLQVQLRQVSTANPVKFDNASAFTNMLFEHLSAEENVAEISVKGLQQLLGNTNSRDVYLHVVRRNLPIAGPTKMTLKESQLNALRAQVDPSYTQPANEGCAKGDRCFANGETGSCLSPAIADGEGGFYCNAEADPVSIGLLGQWCPASPSRNCVLPAGGGYDPNSSALTPGEKLRSVLANYEIYPYYDSGQKVIVAGRSVPRLVPMPSFGSYFTHDGDFYGFLNTIIEEFGSQTSPQRRNLTEIVPDTFFRITIPNEGVGRLRIRTETQDTVPPSFFQIVGTATPLGFGLGNATFTGIARTRAVDLSRGTVTMQKLLEESGKELVTNFKTNITLTRQSGATRNAAAFSYARFGEPTITMQVLNLPLIGQTVTIQVVGASIKQPASCPLFVGNTTLSTQFTLNDGGTAVSVRSAEPWWCVPGQLISF
jgi:hypothetical protein